MSFTSLPGNTQPKGRSVRSGLLQKGVIPFFKRDQEGGFLTTQVALKTAQTHTHPGMGHWLLAWKVDLDKSCAWDQVRMERYMPNFESP